MNKFKFLIKKLKQKLFARKTLSSWQVFVVSLLCLAAGGYYMMYHLFFFGIGLDKLALDRHETESIAMKYDGVQWFRSSRIGPENPLEITTYSLPELDWEKKAPELELFIRLEGLNDSDIDPSKECATLIIEQQPDLDTVFVEEIPLFQVRQQRVKIKWITYTPRSGSKTVPNLFRGKLVVPEGSPATTILLGTKIHANLHRFAWPWYLIGLALFITWATAGHRWKSKLFWLLLSAFIVLLIFRAGAFISNDFFLEISGEASVYKTSFGHMKRFVGAGEWYPHMYKQVGHFLIPAITVILEPFSVYTPTVHYVETYTLPRYIWFLFEVAGVLTLTFAIIKYLSPRVALFFPIIYATFPPILFDVYNMEDDALLIIGMLFLTALLLKISARKKIAWKDMLLCSCILLCMLVTKTTVLFLVVTIPFGIVAARWFGQRRYALQQSGVLFMLLVGALVGSKLVNTAVRPTVREAQPGYAYQNHNLWDMLWAANGLYDSDSAHPFIKSGRERDRVVAEHAANEVGSSVESLFPEGTRDIKRLRHSKIGDELVYKPDLAAAWSERPTFFINNQITRFWRHGLLFYGYPDRGRYWRLDLGGDSSNSSVVQGGMMFSNDNLGNLGSETLVKRSRFDETWKIAVQIYTVSFLNFDRIDDKLTNTVLTLLALFGILLCRRTDLFIVFTACVITKIIFNTVIHGKVRYFDWVHVPMLVGLAVVVSLIIGALWAQSQSYIKKRKRVCPE